MAVISLDSLDPTDPWCWAPVAVDRLLICNSTETGARLVEHGQTLRTWDDPLLALRWMEQSLCDPHIASTARWIGYLSYDCGRWFESLLHPPVDDLHLPLFAFGFVDRDSTPPPTAPPTLSMPGAIGSSFSPDAYRSAVARVIEYIRAGDVFQVNLSQRLAVKTGSSPAAIYRSLQTQSRYSRYSALLDFDSFAIVSHSPELFLRVTPDRVVTTRPIKGTRPRRPDMEAELRDSIKDAAELNMIIDLERNDLGRVCEPGSVRVSQRRTIEPHAAVYHGVATVEGRLRPEVDFVQLLAATFPGGSISGAPKVRAMQIIDELEPVRRGAYCGAIGYLAANGSLEFNVAIRTMTIKDGTAYVPVGGGIVADSDPEMELQETFVKATAMLAALGVRSME